MPIAPSEITPLDEDADNFAKQVAIGAIKDTTEISAYILQARADLEHFVPHDWVLAAINTAYREGLAARDDDHEYLVQQMQEQHQQAEQGMVRATVAAVMESFMEGAPTMFINGNYTDVNRIQVLIDLDKQRTIWDRVTLKNTMDDKLTVVIWELASNKALPKPE